MRNLLIIFRELKHALKGTLVSYRKIDLLHHREQNGYKHPKVNPGPIQTSLKIIRKLLKVSFTHYYARTNSEEFINL